MKYFDLTGFFLFLMILTGCGKPNLNSLYAFKPIPSEKFTSIYYVLIDAQTLTISKKTYLADGAVPTSEFKEEKDELGRKFWYKQAEVSVPTPSDLWNQISTQASFEKFSSLPAETGNARADGVHIQIKLNYTNKEKFYQFDLNDIPSNAKVLMQSLDQVVAERAY